MHPSAQRFHRRAARAVAPVAVALVALASAGCASPPLPEPYAFVARDDGVLEPRIIAAAVEGEACFTQNLITVTLRPPWRVRLANTGGAVTRALDAVPGANVLTHVTVRTRIEQYLLFQRICAIVIGDAGHVE